MKVVETKAESDADYHKNGSHKKRKSATAKLDQVALIVSLDSLNDKQKLQEAKKVLAV